MSQWAKLESLRERAVRVINALAASSQIALTHGSVARGDVDDKSDVDVLIPSNVNTQLVEAAIETAGFTIFSKEIAQATPSHSPKAHLHLDPEQTTSVTVPLTPFRSLELEFYSFGGTVTLPQLGQKFRSPGCTKKLLLIEPIPEGHFESPRPLHPVPLLPRRLGRHLRSGSPLEGRQARDHSQAILSHAENRSFQQLDREDRQPISEGLARLLRHRCGNGNRPPSIRHLQFHQQRRGIVQTQFKCRTDPSDNSTPWINNRMGYLSVYPSSDSRPSHSPRISPRNSQCP